MPEPAKPLTPSQRSDKLLNRLKRRAEEIGFGRLSVEVVIHQGQITQLEIQRSTEILRAE
jgi:hypothetical protein